MTAHAPAPPVARVRRRPTPRPTHWVLLGSLASGLGAYAFQVLGVRALGEAAYQPISVLWTIQYLVIATALYSSEALVTRSTTLDSTEGHAVDRQVRVIGGGVALVALVLGAATWVFRDALFQGEGVLALTVTAIVAAYGGFYVIKGRVAGAGRYRFYGAATALESVGRVLIAVPVLAAWTSTGALAWTMPLGPALVVAWWFAGARRSPPVEGAAVEPIVAEGAAGSARRFLATTTAVNAIAQSLLAAGPLVLIALGAGAAEVSVFFVTITAARVPLVFALGGLLSRLLPPLTRMAEAGHERRLRGVVLTTAAATAACAAVGAAAAWVIGPQVVALFFGESARPGQVFVTLTAAGVLLATGALVLNQILIARGAEQRLPAAWVAALVAAVVALIVAGGGPTLRVSTAFVAGEVVALLGLVVTNLRVSKGTTVVA